jgi:hypothetical protein
MINKPTVSLNNQHLYFMMTEYSALSYEEKRKYMNILTEWYMREKDALNIELNKQHHVP